MAKTTGTVNLVRGEDKIIPFSFRRSVGTPLDLTTASSIVATFRTKNQGFASVTKVGGGIIITSGAAGLIEVSLPSMFTSDMADGDRQDFQIDIILDSKKMIFRFEESINVSESMSAI